MRKIKKPVIGEYVFVSQWCDADLRDAWCIGYLLCIIQYKDKYRYKVIGSEREWPHVFRITKEEGEELLKRFEERN